MDKGGTQSVVSLETWSFLVEPSIMQMLMRNALTNGYHCTSSNKFGLVSLSSVTTLSHLSQRASPSFASIGALYFQHRVHLAS